MKKYIKFATNALFAIGLVLCFLGVGTSDGYIIEMSQDPPRYVWRMIIAGVIMMLPAAVRMLKEEAQWWEWDWR